MGDCECAVLSSHQLFVLYSIQRSTMFLWSNSGWEYPLPSNRLVFCFYCTKIVCMHTFLLGDMLHSNISPIVSVRIFISIYLSLFITVWILSLDYLKNSYDYDIQIFTVSLPWSGIDTLSFSTWSLNHDVIQAPFCEFTLSFISS